MQFTFCSLVIAKLDILDTFEEVKIGVAYKHKGKLLESFPGKNIILVALCPTTIILNDKNKMCTSRWVA